MSIFSADFNVQYILDSKKGKEPRMFFLNDEGIHTVNSTVKLQKTTEQCTNRQVYIRVSPLISSRLPPSLFPLSRPLRGK